MNTVNYDMNDYHLMEMFVRNQRIAAWPVGKDGDTAPSVEGLTQVIDYLVDRLDKAEANIDALHLVVKLLGERLEELEDSVADRLSMVGGI